MKKYAWLLLVVLAFSTTAWGNYIGMNYQNQSVGVIPGPGLNACLMMRHCVIVFPCPIPSPCPPPNLCPNPCLPPNPCPNPCPPPCPPCGGCTADTTSESVCIGGSGECYSQSTANSAAGGQCSSSSSSYSACLPPQTGTTIPPGAMTMP